MSEKILDSPEPTEAITTEWAKACDVAASLGVPKDVIMSFVYNGKLAFLPRGKRTYYVKPEEAKQCLDAEGEENKKQMALQAEYDPDGRMHSQSKRNATILRGNPNIRAIRA